MLVRSNQVAMRIAILLTGATLTSAVLADTEAVNITTDWYLGVEIGSSYFDNGGNPGSVDSMDHRLGGSVFAGLYLNDYFGLETGITYLGTARANYAQSSVTGSTSLIELAGTFRYELTPRLNTYAKAGSAVWFSDSSQSHGGPSFDESGLAPLFAAGLEYSFSNDFAIRVQYQYVHGIGNSDIGEFDSHFTSLGFSWRFGHGGAKAAPMVLVPTKVEPEIILSPIVAPTTKEVIEKPLLAKLEQQPEGVYFELGSSRLMDPESLLPIIVMLSAQPKLTACISGHTDNSGPVQLLCFN